MIVVTLTIRVGGRRWRARISVTVVSERSLIANVARRETVFTRWKTVFTGRKTIVARRASFVTVRRNAVFTRVATVVAVSAIAGRVSFAVFSAVTVASSSFPVTVVAFAVIESGAAVRVVKAGSAIIKATVLVARVVSSVAESVVETRSTSSTTNLARAVVLAGGRSSGSFSAGFFNRKCAAGNDLASELLDGLVGVDNVSHVDKAKATGLSGVRVHHDLTLIDSAKLGEEATEFLFGDRLGDSGNKKISAFVAWVVFLVASKCRNVNTKKNVVMEYCAITLGRAASRGTQGHRGRHVLGRRIFCRKTPQGSKSVHHL